MLKVPTAHGPGGGDPVIRSAHADAEAALRMGNEAAKHPDPQLAERLAEIQAGKAEAAVERLEKAVS